MSDDEIEIIVPDGQSSDARNDRDRRTPRFIWSQPYEKTFFKSLCESVQLGLRENNSFKAEAWDRATKALQSTHAAYPQKSHLINKSDNARKRFRLWRGLREDPEFIYNPVQKTVTATEDAWAAHIEREPLSRVLRGRTFDHEEYMEILFPDVIGSGGAPRRIMKPRRRTEGAVPDDADMSGTSILELHGSLQSIVDAHRQQHNTSLLNQSPGGPSSGTASTQQQMPTAAMSSHSATSSNALTPPDDINSIQGSNRKRRQSAMNGLSEPTVSAFEARPSPSVDSASKSKRPRTSINHATAPTAQMLDSSLSTTSPSRPTPTHPQQPLVEELLEALKSHSGPRWREQALDIFFRDFAMEELDLQVKISENVLSNEQKAMLFCKMPGRVRQHWVGKYRDMHQLNRST